MPLAKDLTTPKPQTEWTTTEVDKVLLNTKAKLFIKNVWSRENNIHSLLPPYSILYILHMITWVHRFSFHTIQVL
jgi:hypothetical protein